MDVLMSIRPYWAEKILTREKNAEVLNYETGQKG